MTYIAIARRWRPTTFDEIVGQEHVTRTLRNAIRLGRIHHAYLFTGARGVGKTTAARVLARALNCERGPTPDPCGECPSCRDILQGSSPDVIEIDGASNNSVDDVRELREAVRYLPQRGRRKVYIVDEVHMLSKGAFNALLKTLEEPPEHVVFIFATTEPQRIPDTILSRVQRFDFKRIPVATVAERLRRICEEEGVRITDEALRLVARAGEGSMRDAQTLLDRVINFAEGDGELDERTVSDILGLVDRGLLLDMAEAIVRGDAARALEVIDRVHGYGFDLAEFAAEMLEVLRDAALLAMSPSAARFVDLPDSERARLGEIIEGADPALIGRAFQVMLEVHDQVARARFPRLVFEMAVARFARVRPPRPVDELIDRLDALERRLRAGGANPPPPARGGGARASGGGGVGGARRTPAAERGAAPAPARAEAASPPVRVGEDAAEPPGAAAAAARPAAPVAAAAAVAAEPAPPSAEPAPPSAEPAPPSAPPAAEATPASAAEPVPAAAEPAAPAEEEPDAPPRGRPDEPPAERFARLQAWLSTRGATRDPWANDAALLRHEPPHLVVAGPTEFRVAQLRRLLDDAEVRRGLAALFPEVRRVAIELVEDARTPRRVRQDARTREREALRARVEGSDLAARVREHLGGRLRAVRFEEEGPPSP